MKEKGKRLAQKTNEITNEIFAVIDGNFSSRYDLNAKVKIRRENDMIPVK
jgi:hypothetical protein